MEKYAAATPRIIMTPLPRRGLNRRLLAMKCPTHHDGIRIAILFLIIPFTGLEATGFSLQQPQHQQHHRHMRQTPPGLYHQHHSSSGGGYPGEMMMTVSPYIEAVKYNTTVFVGQTAYLPCVVKHLGDKTVSWIRKKDLHILTSGNHIYTSDPRVSLLREGKLLNSWILKLNSVQKKDEGSYECQVNTEPKMTSLQHLIVLGTTDEDHTAALALGMLDLAQHQRDSSLDSFTKGYEARILGPAHVQLHQGQTANLTCLVSHGGPSPNITWFLNDIPLQKTSNTRGGINIETEKSPFATISKLVIVRVDRRDEGKYSCGGITVYPDSVVLRVLPFHSGNEDESDEAIPMMVSVASSSARVTASLLLPPSPISSLLISFSKLGIKSHQATCNSNNDDIGYICHNNKLLFSFGELLSPNVINLARYYVSIFPALVIVTVISYQNQLYQCCQ